MKRTLLMALLVPTILFSNLINASAWGQVGHSTIAQVAQNHLTPKAKEALHRYLDALLLHFLS